MPYYTALGHVIDRIRSNIARLALVLLLFYAYFRQINVVVFCCFWEKVRERRVPIKLLWSNYVTFL